MHKHACKRIHQRIHHCRTSDREPFPPISLLRAGYPERGRDGAKYVVGERPQRTHARGEPRNASIEEC
jgi:hypothetical protein